MWTPSDIQHGAVSLVQVFILAKKIFKQRKWPSFAKNSIILYVPISLPKDINKQAFLEDVIL